MRAARAIAALLVLDLLWVRGVMVPRYRSMIRKVQGGREMRARWPPAVAAYACMVVGLRVFVLGRARGTSVARGLAFGAVLYGMYNGTCLAVLADWDARVALLDVAWGSALYGLAAAVA